MADTTVTGRIGDMDVALINAASEATLIKLLETMKSLENKMGPSGTGGSGAGTTSASPQGKNTAAVNNSTSAFNQAGRAVGSFASAIADATKGVLNFAGNIIGGAFLALKNLTTELFLGGDRVSDFTKHLANLPSIFGVLGTVIHSLSSWIEQGVDTFRSLSQVGAGYTGSLSDMRRMAAESGMSLERFSKTVVNNAEKIALLGVSVSLGAKRFADLSRQMREGEAGQRLMRMGFSIDEINETLLDYASINARMGRTRRLSDEELIRNAAAFGEELNKAAAATGLSRRELAASVEKLDADIVMQALASRFKDPKQADAFKVGMGQLISLFKESGGMILEAASGFYNSDELLALQSMSSNFIKIPQQFAKGQITALDTQNAMAEEARRVLKRLEDPAYYASMKSVAGFDKAYKALLEMAKVQYKSEEQRLAEQKKQAEGTKIDNFYKSFTDVIERFRAKFALKILDSEVFKKFEETLNDVLGDNLEKKFPRIMDDIASAFENILRVFNTFISDWQSSGFKEALNNLLIKMFDIKPDELLSKPDKNGERTEITATQAILNRIGNAMLEGIKSMFSSLTDAAIEFAKKHWLEITAVVVGLFAGGKLLGAAFGGKKQDAGGDFSAMKSLGASFANAADWLLKGAAIGGSMIAIGYGLQKLAEGIIPFQEIDWESMAKAGSALTVLVGAITLLGKLLTGPQIVGFGVGTAAIGALGLALQAFPTDLLKEFGVVVEKTFKGVASILGEAGAAIEKVVGSIAKMRTGVMEATTKQISDLSGIPSSNIEATAAAIEKLKDALNGFSPGMFRGFSEMLGGMFASDKIGPLEKMAELGPRLGAAAPGFTAFKEAMGGGFKVDGLALTQQQTRSVEVLAKELPAYAAGLQAVSLLGPNLNNTAEALRAFVEASQGVDLQKFIFSNEQKANLVDGTNKIRDLATQLANASREFKKLDDTGLKKIKEGVEGLSKSFEEFNKSFIDKFLPKFDQLKSTTQEGLLTEMGVKLDTLNSNVSALVGIERDSRGYLNTISTQRPGRIS